jgi:predicted murein hydrolase (TIGR00659 family)
VNHALLALWTPLAPTPLLWIVLTLAAYAGARYLQRICRDAAYINPVLIAILVVGAVLLATRTPYATYFAGAQFINFLLGPATVALAVPLARNVHQIRTSFRGVSCALLAGCVTSIVGGVGLVWLLGGSREVALSMAPKGVTTPIAMAVSQQIGGVPALTAAFAIISGIIAAIVGKRLLGHLRVEDGRAHGFAAGVAGSGVAAAQVVTLGSLAAAFAALGIALNGVLTALVTPLIMQFWH